HTFRPSQDLHRRNQPGPSHKQHGRDDDLAVRISTTRRSPSASTFIKQKTHSLYTYRHVHNTSCNTNISTYVRGGPCVVRAAHESQVCCVCLQSRNWTNGLSGLSN